MQLKSGLSLRLLTHNIRYAAEPPSKGEAPWEERLPRLVSQFLYHTAHCPASILCLQEVLHHQAVDIVSALNNDLFFDGDRSTNQSEWDYIGRCRDDGDLAGESCPIIFRRSVWDIRERKTLWLSETPEIPGRKGWDAASVRVVTVLRLRHRESGMSVLFLNTHFDNVGIRARRESAIMIKRIVQEESGGDPVVVMGDLNSESEDDAYKVLTGQNGFPTPLVDAEAVCRQTFKYGERLTFTGFSSDDGPPQKLDYIFVGPSSSERAVIERYSVLPNRFEDGIFYSDHRAVVVDATVR